MFCIVHSLFLALSTYIVTTGPILIYFEKYAPDFLLRLCNYGSFSYKGNKANFVSAIEIPKSMYSHFYINACVTSVITFLYMLCVYFGGLEVNEYVLVLIKVLMGDSESVCVLAALLAMLLMTIQILRRLYETTRLQVFAKGSRMNILHYFLGIVHYYFVVVGILGHAPLFNGNQTLIWIDLPTTLIFVPATIVFSWAFLEQYQSNIILANLRKDKGRVVTEGYSVPKGRWFELVSSPHRMCEVVMYIALWVIQRTDTSFYMLFWVVTNQCEMALLAHKWYKNEFKNYPIERKAIIPFVL